MIVILIIIVIIITVLIAIKIIVMIIIIIIIVTWTPKTCRITAFFSGFWVISLPTFGGLGILNSNNSSNSNHSRITNDG